ncbi:MAG: hypothetical protein GY735_10430 [Delftia sp.]|nr:hypothetical protein [Delftia sp.]
MKQSKLITHKDYMSNSSELHHKYYLQFATESTKRFILSELSIKDIKNALNNGDEHLNKIKIPFNNMGRGGSWWWDHAPIDIKLARELGCVGLNSIPSPATITCVAKAMAKELTK